MLTKAHYEALYGRSAVTLIADAERAVKLEQLKGPRLKGSVPVTRIGGVMPDWIAFTVDANGVAAELRTLESKGCHTSAVKVHPREMLKALADARIQVCSLEVGGACLSGWMACAVIAERAAAWPGLPKVPADSVTLYALDPPSAPRDGGRNEPRVWRRPGGAWSVRDESTFQQTLDEVGRAALLSYAGFVEDAAEVVGSAGLRLGAPDVSRQPGTATRPNDQVTGRRYEGTEVVLRVAPNVELNLFLGIDSAIRGGLLEGSAVDEIQTFRRQRGDGIESDTVEIAQDSTYEQVRSISRDGTVLDVRVTAPRDGLNEARNGLPAESSEDDE